MHARAHTDLCMECACAAQLQSVVHVCTLANQVEGDKVTRALCAVFHTWPLAGSVVFLFERERKKQSLCRIIHALVLVRVLFVRARGWVCVEV